MNRQGCRAAIMIGMAVLVVAGLALAAGRPGRVPGTRLGPGDGRPGQCAMGHCGVGQPGVLRLILRTLDLTDEQRELIKAILEAAKPDMEAAREAVAEASATLNEAVVQGADEDTILAAASALGDAIGAQAVLRAQTIASIKAVLTEEQLAQLDENLAREAELEQIEQLCWIMG